MINAGNANDSNKKKNENNSSDLHPSQSNNKSVLKFLRQVS